MFSPLGTLPFVTWFSGTKKPLEKSCEKCPKETWTQTLAKVSFHASLLAGVAYASYWTGVSNAAKTAGQAFEDFMNQAEFPSVNTITGGAKALAHRVSDVLIPAGALAKSFGDYVLAHTPGPNLNITTMLGSSLIAMHETAKKAVYYGEISLYTIAISSTAHLLSAVKSIAAPILAPVATVVKGGVNLITFRRFGRIQ